MEEVLSLHHLTQIVNLNSSHIEALQIYSLVDMEEISVSKYHYKYHHPMASSRLGLVAQLVERRTSKPKVAGSNPNRGQVEFFSTYPVWVRFTWKKHLSLYHLAQVVNLNSSYIYIYIYELLSAIFQVQYPRIYMRGYCT